MKTIKILHLNINKKVLTTVLLSNLNCVVMLGYNICHALL